MYIVICEGIELEFSTLSLAIEYAKVLNVFVTIKGRDFEAVGKFGVDSVEKGRCPDGIEYSWYKRRKP